MQDVVERFLRYATCGTTANPESNETPSTPTQHTLAKMLEHELEELGLDDVQRTEHAYVTASLPASECARTLPAIGLIAHIDTADAIPNDDIHPRIVDYSGGNLVMGEVDGHEICVTEEECPDLAHMVGKHIICTDGTSLLGADDKAGVAEIMALLARLRKDSSLLHPAIKVAFVPDEEIGHGARLLSLHDFGATWAYTVDGGELGEISYETFNAAEAVITIHGNMVHPGSAKDLLINATSLYAEFDRMIDVSERPEHTEGYQGFYHCTGVSGNETKLVAHYILRDFAQEGLAARKQAVEATAAAVEAQHPGSRVEVAISDSYSNMEDVIKNCMFLVDNAIAANKEVGIEPVVRPIRGGTDGSQLSARGLPCPNLATGGYFFHSVREFIAVEDMEHQVDMLQHLVAHFAEAQPTSTT